MGYKYKKNKDGTITIVTTEDEEYRSVENEDGSVSITTNQNVRFEDEEIAPTKQTTTEAPVKEEKERSWFQKSSSDSLFDTIGGTVQDVRENLLSGLLGIGESVVDAGAYVAGALVGKVNEDFADKTKEFIAKDLYDEKEVAKKIIGATTFDYMEYDTDKDSVLGDKTEGLLQ